MVSVVAGAVMLHTLTRSPVTSAKSITSAGVTEPVPKVITSAWGLLWGSAQSLKSSVQLASNKPIAAIYKNFFIFYFSVFSSQFSVFS